MRLIALSKIRDDGAYKAEIEFHPKEGGVKKVHY